VRQAELQMFRSEAARARYLALYSARIREWPVPYDELYLSTRYGRTYVIASGAVDAPPLVLLPCMMGSATMWRANVAGLSRHFRTYAVDVIGEPNKSETEKLIWTRRGFADWFEDLLDALAIARTSIVGNSYGGFLALNQALFTPDRVDRVVLISPAGTFKRLSLKFFYYVFLASGLRLKGLHSRGRQWIKNGVDFQACDANWEEMMALVTFEGARMNFVAPAIFSKAELGRIRAPTLLLIGDKEVLYEPYETLALAKRRMAKLQAEIVYNANHTAGLARPEDVSERILRFLHENRVDPHATDGSGFRPASKPATPA
jgi:pimeloyl-ACP methyl ester carboxylesterase